MQVIDKKTNIQHIYFCADRKYLPCTSATMASILVNATENSNQVFHLISDDITPDDIAKLARLSLIKPTELVLHRIISDDFSIYKKEIDFGYSSINTMHRLKILDFAPEDCDKILYLDGDMIVTEPLDELFATDLKGYYAGVVEEKDAFQAENLNLKSGRYFNAGMLLINVYALQRHNLFQEALTYYQQNKKYITSHDQDILNGIWDGKVKFLPQRYNVPSFVKNEPNPLIIHYTGYVKKPWRAYCRHPLKDTWLKYSQMSPYKKSAFKLKIFLLHRFLTKIFYFCKDPTHKNFYILSIFGMNFTLGKKDNKIKQRKTYKNLKI